MRPRPTIHFQQVVHDPLAFVAGRVKCGKEAREIAAAAAAAVADSTADAEDEDGEKGDGEGKGAARKQARRQLVRDSQADQSEDEGESGSGGSSGEGADSANSGVHGVTPMAQQLRGVKQHYSELVWSMDGGGAGSSSRGSGGRGGADSGDEDQAICEWLVRHAVSVHMHGRSYTSYDDAAAAMSHVARSHQKAMRVLWERQQQQQKQRAIGGRL